MSFDCIIVGGGIAGLQAAIQLGRYRHKVLVLDSGDGRSTLCKSYHNILGYPQGISGEYLRTIGRKQAEQLGVQFVLEQVEKAEKNAEGFILTVHNGVQYEGRRLLLATGVMDRLPPLPSLYPCLGRSVYICPDCDGFEIADKCAIIIGSGNVGANMAITLTYWTHELIYVNHEQTPIEPGLVQQLAKWQIPSYNEPIQEVLADGDQFKGVLLQSGKRIEANHAFVAFGSNEVKSSLAVQLGVQCLENQHILVDPRTRITNIENVWAAGDVVAHSEQVTIAMGDGSQAAIWIHKSLLK